MEFGLISGMLRSGTTLLDKLVGAQPLASVRSQPFTEVMLQPKRDFHARLGIGPNELPLNHYFGERRYRPQDFSDYLETYVPDRDVYQDLVPSPGRELMKGKGLESEYLRFHTLLARLYQFSATKNGVCFSGAKEVLCEEYFPYLLRHGFYAIIIIRDPRDVVASLNYGKGQEFTGKYRPTLFNIRNWRKSVAFALELTGHPQFMYLRYEDLVTEPAIKLEQVCNLLHLESDGKVPYGGGIRDENDKPWSGNSSFAESTTISSSAIGGYTNYLPDDVVRYVEALCWPEMVYLGYEPVHVNGPEPDIIKRFREPYPVTREEFDPEYSSATQNVEAELERVELLSKSRLAADEIPCFLFDSAHNRLRSVLTGRAQT